RRPWTAGRASSATLPSGRPPSRSGSSPAPAPPQAAASVWYGGRCPTPPVSSAEATIVVTPSRNPNPAPNTRPPSTSSTNTVPTPPVPDPLGRTSAPPADSRPSIATARTSNRPSEPATRVPTSAAARATPTTRGAVVAEASTQPCAISSGQPNASNPTRDTAPSTSPSRAPAGTARPARHGEVADQGCSAVIDPPRVRRRPRRR